MKQIPADASALQLDASEAPESWWLTAVDGDGVVLDVIEEFHDSKIAHATSERIARQTGLPYTVRRVPHFA